jgi:hypothetical protein
MPASIYVHTSSETRRPQTSRHNQSKSMKIPKTSVKPLNNSIFTKVIDKKLPHDGAEHHEIRQAEDLQSSKQMASTHTHTSNILNAKPPKAPRQRSSIDKSPLTVQRTLNSRKTLPSSLRSEDKCSTPLGTKLRSARCERRGTSDDELATKDEKRRPAPACRRQRESARGKKRRGAAGKPRVVCGSPCAGVARKRGAERVERQS